MSAGVIPVVTDIPSFRVIAGDSGARWPPGDARAFSTALRDVCARNLARGAEHAWLRNTIARCAGKPSRGGPSTNTRRSSIRSQSRRPGSTRRMKIAIVVTGGLHPERPRASGAVVAGVVLGAGDNARGSRVRVAPPPGSREATRCSASMFTISAARRRRSGCRDGRRNARWRAAMSAHGRFDVIHGIWGDPAGQLAVRMGKRFSLPAIVDLRQRRIRIDAGDRVRIATHLARAQRRSRSADRVTHPRLQRVHGRQGSDSTASQPIVIPLTTVRARRFRESRIRAPDPDSAAVAPGRQPESRQEPAAADRCAGACRSGDR